MWFWNSGLIKVIIVQISLMAIFGFVTKTISKNKGYAGGFWWGFFLGILGLIVVICKPDCRKPEEPQCVFSDDPSIVTGGSMYDKPYHSLDLSENSQKKKESARNEKEKIEMIKSYKELLDIGAITQEEFDKKKSELL